MKFAMSAALDPAAGPAAGLVFGRNIHEAEDPATALACFRQIVHGE
jgi:DhnA family fructose-bisphosphate aldolase class Ia